MKQYMLVKDDIKKNMKDYIISFVNQMKNILILSNLFIQLN